MGVIKRFLKRLPGLAWTYRRFRTRLDGWALARRDPEEVFTAFYYSNHWGGAESVSGTGSDAPQTGVVVRELSALVRELGVRSLLDLPCGDFNWMQQVRLEGASYTGGDIVRAVIESNSRRFARPGVAFLHLDILSGSVPRSDLVLCRDCLVHFSTRDVWRALANLKSSGSRYLLTTTFPGHSQARDIATGQWRPLNLQLPPFNFPSPLRLINEGCTEDGGAYRDKSLGLWPLSGLV